jgi:hypothetical protein
MNSRTLTKQPNHKKDCLTRIYKYYQGSGVFEEPPQSTPFQHISNLPHILTYFSTLSGTNAEICLNAEMSIEIDHQKTHRNKTRFPISCTLHREKYTKLPNTLRVFLMVAVVFGTDAPVRRA